MNPATAADVVGTPGERTGGNVVLLSGHYYESRRRAGFHFLADALERAGWDVTFVTVALSWLSALRRDPRMQYPVRAESGELKVVREGLASLVLFTPYHPANLRAGALNQLATPLFRRYGRRLPDALEARVVAADVIIFESTPGLLLAERCRALNGHARFVYRVSDDLRLLNNHPVVLETEARLTPKFDVVSVPTEGMAGLFDTANLRVQPHGLDKQAFDREVASPFPTGTRNAVFVGNARFDRDFLGRAAALFPGVRFHVIGPVPDVPPSANVCTYGEVPFDETVPYIQHADLGLHTLEYSPGAEVFKDSLKVQQYTYCRLPVVAPEFLRSDRTNVFCYVPGDNGSIGEAITGALALNRASVDRAAIRSWDDVALELVA